MSNTNRHSGFHQEAPEEVNWSPFSYIKPVNHLDARSMAPANYLSFFGFFGMFVSAGILLALSEYLSDDFPILNSLLPALICVCFILAGILIGLFRGHLLKWSMINNIRSRSELLFEPGRDCIFVGIEDAFTFDKLKFMADDYGLLKITDDSMLLEMTKYRARFKTTDLKAALLHTGKNLVAVRLSCNQKPYQWSVALTPIALSRNILNELNGRVKAERLFNILIKAGVGVPQTSQGAETAAEKAEVLNETDEVTAQHVEITSDSAEHGDLMENRYQNVLEEIEKKQKKKKSSLINVVILFITLVLFFQLGVVHWGLEEVILILIVLAVHEAGHFLGMKLFGYKNIQMFFVPLLGAAVSGTGRNVSTWKKALVTLSGPLPGIFISLVLFIIYLNNGREILRNAGLMFIFINAFNLLPIMPLDGGRFMNEVLFSRSKYIQLAANISAAAIFLLIGFGAGIWLFEILGILNLVTIQYNFKLTSRAKQIQRDLEKKGEFKEETFLGQSNEDHIPEHFLKQMVDWIYKNMPGLMKPKVVATIALELWDRIRILPPKWGMTIILLSLFFFGYVVSFVSLGAFSLSYYSSLDTKIVQYQDPNGTIRHKEQCFYNDLLESETQLSKDRTLYHGYHKEYFPEGELVTAGQWNMGMRSGKWEYYEPNGLLVAEIFYEDGKPVIRKILEEGKWEEYGWDDFSAEEKAYYEQEAQIRQGPGEQAEFDFFESPQDYNDIPEPCIVTLI